MSGVWAVQQLVIFEGPVNTLERSDFEAFLVDGIINLEAKIPRELSVVKMRGTPLPRRTFLFTMSGGFNLINSETIGPMTAKTWRPVMPTAGLISSGIEDFDALLGGGFKPGTYAVIVAGSNVAINEICLFTHPTVCNFLSQGRGVVYLPPGGMDNREIVENLSPFLQTKDLETLRVAEELRSDEPFAKAIVSAKYQVLFKGEETTSIPMPL